MKLKSNLILLFIVLCIIFNLNAYADNVYENFVIREQEIKKDNKYIGSKIEIYKIHHPETASSETGELIWTITADHLPVDINLCYKYTFDPCDSAECVAPCLRYGPRFINLDEKTNKIYFYVNSTAVGATGMGLRFVFVGDIYKKEIKYLSLVSGPIETIFSPTYRYLVFYGLSKLTVFDTLKNNSFTFGKDNVWTSAHKRIYGLGDIHWLSDTRFSYTESWRPDKFSDYSNDIIEHVYDIPTRKIISSRKII